MFLREIFCTKPKIVYFRKLEGVFLQCCGAQTIGAEHKQTIGAEDKLIIGAERMQIISAERKQIIGAEHIHINIINQLKNKQLL